MRKTENNLILISMLFVVSLVIANVLAGKVVDTGIPFIGGTIAIPGAVFAYAFTFLFTDVVNEIWGKFYARRMVLFGFFGQILATALILLTQPLPALADEMQDAYMVILGQNWVFVIGSMTAYFVSQLFDVHVFHKIKMELMNKFDGNRNLRWVWNNVSTALSQIIDTAIFITIAFGLGYRWLFTEGMTTVLIGMIIGQYFVKLAIALLDTPVFYFLTRNNK